jgi:hypothetical protein
MTMHFSDLAAQAVADGTIAPDEIMDLRRAGWADGRMDPDEAESLFVANDAVTEYTREWTDFFVEALSNFVVNTVEPSGYVDQEMADELVSRIDRDGRVDSVAEIELLVRVLEISTSVPDSLKTYALQQIEIAVEHGEGPTRDDSHDGNGISPVEATLLRRMLFAAGGDRPAAVSKAEAALLFRLKDATLYDGNCDEWRSLFVQGVANYLLGFGGSDPLSAQRAGELEAFMQAEGAGIGSFLARMLTSKPDVDGAFGSLLGRNGDEADYLEELSAHADHASAFTAEEHSWLNDQLEADEELDEMEKALIAFLDAETGESFVPRKAA